MVKEIYIFRSVKTIMEENKIEGLKRQIETLSQNTEISIIFAEKVGMRNKYIFKIGNVEVFENKILLETDKYIVFYKEVFSASQKEMLDKIQKLIKNSIS
jgi:lipopolysaccharide export system protein LptA